MITSSGFQAFHCVVTSEEDDFSILDVGQYTETGLNDEYQTTWTCNSASVQNLSSAFSTPPPRVRLVSIHSSSTVGHLKISRTTLDRIFERYEVEPEFLDTLQCFGSPPHYSEGGTTNAFIRGHESISRSCGYTLQYVEDNHRVTTKGRGETISLRPWSHRHSTIYHKRLPRGHDVANPSAALDFFILVHPRRNSVFEKRVCEMLQTGSQSSVNCQRLCAQPEIIHDYLLSSYLPNWRPCLRYYGSGFAESNDHLFTTEKTDLFAIDNLDTTSPHIDFDFVRQLRHYRDQIISMRPLCQGNSTVLKTVQHMCRYPAATSVNHFEGRLDAYEEKVRGYLLGLDTLRGRMDNAIDLLQYALDYKNVKTDTEMNSHIVKLTHSAADDSKAVAFITILGGLYLPGTFMSGIFGMNFFNFDSNSNRLVVGQNFWIFCAFWLPITGITCASYLIYLFWRKHTKQEQEYKVTVEANERALRRDTMPAAPSTSPVDLSRTILKKRLGFRSGRPDSRPAPNGDLEKFPHRP